MVDDVDHEVSESDVGAGEERRWPAWVALFTAGWAPGTTARRTEHVGLLGAFGVHLLSALAVAFVICCMVAWAEGISLVAVVREMINVLSREYRREPEITVVAMVMSVVVVEGGLLVVALVLCPWGARDESIRSSRAASVRRTWIQSSQALYIALMIGVTAVPLHDAWWEWSSTWRASLPNYPTAPQSPAANATPAELEAYDAKMEVYVEETKAYQAEWSRLWRTRPWYVKQNDVILSAVVAVAAVWWLLALLRSVGTRREVEPIQRAPMCECCGYNLTGSASDGVCPECGEGVEVSLGPSAIRRSTWERRGEWGWWGSWWRCVSDAAFRPVLLGRQLPVSRWSVDHRRFLLAHIAVVFVLTWVGLPLCYYGSEGHNPFVKEPEVVWAMGPGSGLAVSVGLLLFALGAAYGVGEWFSRSDGRNLLPATIQAVSYLGGYLCFWVLFNCVTGPLVLASVRCHYWRWLERLTKIDEEVLAFVVWVIPNGILAVLFLVRLLRITSGARHANS